MCLLKNFITLLFLSRNHHQVCCQKSYKMVHEKCRNGVYPNTNIKRFPVPLEKVFWSTRYSEYFPPEYNHPKLEKAPWADPPIGVPGFKPVWNGLDGNINRGSYMGDYEIDRLGQPLNPCGRTGIIGRGLLGKWGPNHAADPIVTRWKRDGCNKVIHPKSLLHVLQFCAIERRDCNEWAIPGGMVDPGEKVSQTLKREFKEEALNAIGKNETELENIDEVLENFFADGLLIYKGYVDDPRNTDNAWMETVAVNYHDPDGKSVGSLKFEAGDDAAKVKWIDIDKDLNLYANHADFIRKVAKVLNAHW